MQAYQLDSAIDAIRLKFGREALTRAAELSVPQPWRTESALDRLTGIGGLPRGRLSLLTGAGTCGKLTLALQLVAHASRALARAIVIDSGGFDPWCLLPFSPELSALTVVSAQALETAGESAAMLARAGAGFILLTCTLPEHWIGPLESGASRSGAVVVAVVDEADRALAHASSFTVAFSRQEWICERGELVGVQVSVRCTKNRVAPPLGETALEIRYPLSSQSPPGHRAGVTEADVSLEEVSSRASAAV